MDAAADILEEALAWYQQHKVPLALVIFVMKVIMIIIITIIIITELEICVDRHLFYKHSKMLNFCFQPNSRDIMILMRATANFQLQRGNAKAATAVLEQLRKYVYLHILCTVAFKHGLFSIA